MKLKIKKLNPESELPLPQYATSGSAGMDVCAEIIEPIIIEPGKTVMVATGLATALEPGWEIQVRSRSGLAAKHGIFALNAPGTIDSDYRGEIKVILSNFGSSPFKIERGDRIAQLVLAQYEQAQWDLTENLSETERGEGGFGSTGK